MEPWATSLVLDALQDAGELIAVRGVLPAQFADITDDSRRVARLGPGTLFLAVRGTALDGHAFIPAARAAGAAAVVVEEDHATDAVPSLVVRNSRRTAALAAAAVFGHPQSGLWSAGVTGTNGKTTTVAILRHLLDMPGRRAASIGTLGVVLPPGTTDETGGKCSPLPDAGGLTTPGVVELFRTLRALRDRGITALAMEVSSHSLDQDRIEGMQFDAAVYTNLTRDHLDYHGTMSAYAAAKARLLDHVAPEGTAVINADVTEWSNLPRLGRRVTFGLSSVADVRAEDVRCHALGSDWFLMAGGERTAVSLPLIGDYNVSNALAAAAAAWSSGLTISQVAEGLSCVPQVPGRMERILDRPLVLRDYAHTPDALERALLALRPLVSGRLLVVFGCGGDRDRGKRPLMGAVAARHADIAIITSDNPRTEDPERILDEIEAGMGACAHERIESRRAAIARALRLAVEGDIVLLAGKGHETYQIRGEVRHPFDERIVAAELSGSTDPGAK